MSRSATSSPSGSFTSHRPAVGNPSVTRQKPGRPTGSYTRRRPIGGSPLFGGGNIFIGGNIFGGGNFSGSYTGSDSGTDSSGTYTTQADSAASAQGTTGSTTTQAATDSTVAQQTADNSTGTAQTVQQNTVRGGSTVQSTGKRKSGCLTSMVSVFIWGLLLVLFFSFVSGALAGDSDFTKSTIHREKLHLNLSDEAGYYTDECGWIDNRTKLENGLKDFYGSTGILPYVYIIDNVDGDYDPSTEVLEEFAEAAYESLFDDRGHALLVFWDYAGAYEYVLWLGDDAAELMDTEACDILFDYLDYYYYEDVTDEEFFAAAFSEAGERMMKVEMTAGQYFKILAVVAAVIVIIYIIYKQRKARQAKEEERRRRAEEILNAPLEKFGENGDIIDELEKKYEKEI